MKASKIIKTALFAAVFAINLFLALSLWLCGLSGNIMLGILFIIGYRLSLWTAPLIITIICWLPLPSRASPRQKLLMNLLLLGLCALLFVTCFLLFGNWY
ncbi:MAG: hypothetical protein IKC75_04700 [Clostridia bacterium]|nr:hypothetical protein [Clostridia bacterium]